MTRSPTRASPMGILYEDREALGLQRLGVEGAPGQEAPEVAGHRARATIRLSGTLGGDQVARPRLPEPAEVLTPDPQVAPGLRLSVRHRAGELGVLAEEF